MMSELTGRLGSGRLLDLRGLLGSGSGGLVLGDDLLLATQLVEEFLATGLGAVLGRAVLALRLGASGTLRLGVGALLGDRLGRNSESRLGWGWLENCRQGRTTYSVSRRSP
jgi:hypothetical protein